MYFYVGYTRLVRTYFPFPRGYVITEFYCTSPIETANFESVYLPIALAFSVLDGTLGGGSLVDLTLTVIPPNFWVLSCGC